MSKISNTNYWVRLGLETFLMNLLRMIGNIIKGGWLWFHYVRMECLSFILRGGAFWWGCFVNGNLVLSLMFYYFFINIAKNLLNSGNVDR